MRSRAGLGSDSLGCCLSHSRYGPTVPAAWSSLDFEPASTGGLNPGLPSPDFLPLSQYTHLHLDTSPWMAHRPLRLSMSRCDPSFSPMPPNWFSSLGPSPPSLGPSGPVEGEAGDVRLRRDKQEVRDLRWGWEGWMRQFEVKTKEGSFYI